MELGNEGISLMEVLRPVAQRAWTEGVERREEEECRERKEKEEMLG